MLMAAFPSGGMTSFLLKRSSWFKFHWCFVDEFCLMTCFVGTCADAQACHALGDLIVNQSFFVRFAEDLVMFVAMQVWCKVF